MAQSNAERARCGFEAITRGDFDSVAEALDPDVKWHGGDPEYGCVNREQALTWMRGAAERRGGRLPELVDVIEAGDRVAVIMQPPPTDDDPAPQRTANLTTFRDGKVIEMIHYPDAADALAALGLSSASG